MDSFDGGRGIANRIETHFINPLARQFFQDDPKGNICIAAVEERNGKTFLSMDTGAPVEEPFEPEAIHPAHPVLPTGMPSTQRPKGGVERWRARFDKTRI